jgi:hypothetical protein
VTYVLLTTPQGFQRGKYDGKRRNYETTNHEETTAD